MTKLIRSSNSIYLFLAFFFILLNVNPAISAEKEKLKVADDKKIAIARINDEYIYKEQLQPLVEKQLGNFNKGSGKGYSEDLVKEIYETELEKIIGHELLVQASKSLKIKNIDEEVNEKIGLLKKRYPTEEMYNAYVMKGHETEKDLRLFLAKDIILKKYLDKMGFIRPEVPESDIRKLYEQKKESFKTDEAVKVNHIVIFIEKDASQEAIEKAKAKAEMVMEQLKKGDDFETLAAKYSEDQFAVKGGNLGFVEKGYLPVDAEKIAFSMEVGKISDIIKSSVGYQILKVVEKQPKGFLPLEKVRDFIVKYLQQGISKEKITSHINELRGKASIEIYRENFKL